MIRATMRCMPIPSTKPMGRTRRQPMRMGAKTSKNYAVYCIAAQAHIGRFPSAQAAASARVKALHLLP
jgi:hypothetical protein